MTDQISLQQENIKLRRLVAEFKKKYQRTLQQGSEDQKCEISKRCQELVEENGALVEQQNLLKQLTLQTKEDCRQESLKHKQLYDQAKEDAAQARKECFQLTQTLQMAQEGARLQVSSPQSAETSTCQNNIEKELEEKRLHCQQLDRVIGHLRERVEEARLEKDGLQEEFQKLHLQFQEILQKFEDEQKENRELKVKLQTISAINRYRDDEIILLQKNLAKTKEELDSSLKNIENLPQLEEQLAAFRIENERLTSLQEEKEKELTKIKEILAQALRETRKAHNQFQVVSAEKGSLIKNCSQLKNMLETSNEELNQLQKERIKWQEQAQENQKRQEEFLQQQTKLAELADQAENGQCKINTLEQELLAKENDIQEARMHLAKRVREANTLSERLESMEKELESALHRVEGSNQELRILKSDLEGQKQFQEQLERSESKYATLLEKWQQSEQRNKEAAKLQQKHSQLQLLLKELGESNEPIQLNKREFPISMHQEEPVPVAKEQSLFDNFFKKVPTPKRDLFE